MKEYVQLVCLLLFCYGGILKAENLEIVSAGKSDYQIVLPDRSDSEATAEYLKEAASALQKAFQEGGNVMLPVVLESSRNPKRPGIYIGDTAMTRKNGIKASEFQNFNSVIAVIGKNVFLAGCDRLVSIHTNRHVTRKEYRHYRCKLGSVKATVEFMRRYLGSRFLMPGETGTTTPAFQKLNLKQGVDQIQPLLLFAAGRPTELMYDYANASYGYGDFYSYGGHSYYSAVSASLYAEKHPEYFRMEEGGKRSAAGGHLCISNPQVQELFYQEILRRFADGAKVVQLAQTDGYIPCLCPECAKLGGSTPGEKIWFVHRKLAERLYREFPDRKLHILAYVDTARPPVSFREFPPNVIIELCTYTESNLRRWSQYRVDGGFTAYIYNWGCYNQPGFTPKRTPEYCIDQVRMFREYGIKGVYRCGFGENFGLEGPIYYCFGQALERDNVSAKELADEYYRYAYNEVYVPMRAFHELLNRQVAIYSRLAGDSEISGDSTIASLLPRDPRALLTALYPVGILNTLESKLAAAERNARNLKTIRRLKLVRLEFDYLKTLLLALHEYQHYQAAPNSGNFEHLVLRVKQFRKFVLDRYDAKKRIKGFPEWPELQIFGNPPMNMLLSNGRLSASIGSPFCWDMDALRKINYLPGAKVSSLTVLRTSSIPEFNEFESGNWKKAEWNHLNGIQLGKIKEKSKFKVLYDKDNIYFAFISKLAPEKKYNPVGKDGAAWATDCLEIMIDPDGMREKFFHFIWNPVQNSTWDGAYGLIKDPLHPKYDADDILWNGKWSYRTRREGGLWYSLVTIPYSTLQTTQPVPGSVWCLNVAREGFKIGGRMYSELSLWSPNFEDMRINKNRESFGEMHFK